MYNSVASAVSTACNAAIAECAALIFLIFIWRCLLGGKLRVIEFQFHSSPTRNSIAPEASHFPRFSGSVSRPQTRSIGPGSTRSSRTVPGSVTAPYSLGCCPCLSSCFFGSALHRDDPFFFLVVFANARSSASNRASRGVQLGGPTSALCLSIHVAAPSIGSGLMDSRCPALPVAAARVARPPAHGCGFDTALSDNRKGKRQFRNPCLPARKPLQDRSPRRSASAIKVWFSPNCLAGVIIIPTYRLNICRGHAGCQSPTFRSCWIPSKMARPTSFPRFHSNANPIRT